jgi:hypothetical protein
MKPIIVLIAVLAFGSFLVSVTMQGCTYDKHAGGHFGRAAAANTIEIAQEELATGIAYIEAHGMTSGYTSIFYETPDENVGFYYKNLIASQAELRSLSSSTSTLEKSNALLKLRETLLQEDGRLDEPSGISLFPNNALYALWGWLSFIFLVAAVAVCIPWDEL